jgi:hypothetical protein
MKADHRRLEDTHLATVKAGPYGLFCLELEGANSHGHPVTVTAQIPWTLWPLIVKESAKAWLVEKKARLQEISFLDKNVLEDPAI